MNTFSLQILACDRVFYKGDCVSLTFPATDGEMCILAHHEPMTAVVEIGELRFEKPDGTKEIAVVSDGLVEVAANHVEVIVFSAERPDEIDAFRAQEAYERAQEQLKEKQSIQEYYISSASMARAMARLRARGKHVKQK